MNKLVSIFSKPGRTVVAATIALAAVVGLATLSPVETHAACSPNNPTKCAQGGVNQTGGQGQGTVDNRVKNIVNLLIYVVGIAAVIMIVVGGIKYATSGGDSSGILDADEELVVVVVLGDREAGD